MSGVRTVPLAPPALRTPDTCDPSFQIAVRLKEPLWSVQRTPGEIATAVMAQCAQLEAVARAKKKLHVFIDVSDIGKNLDRQRDRQTAVKFINEELSRKAMGRKVTFETTKDSTVRTIMARLKDFLSQLPLPESDILGYLEYSGLAELYPRGAAVVEAYERCESVDDQMLDEMKVPTDGYFPQLAMLHQLVVMCKQLDHDIVHLSNHKYMAHQTALLFQCVNQAGPFLAQEKTAIEQNFKAIKSACATQEGSEMPPQLPSHLKQWLQQLTESIRTKVTKFPSQLTQSLKPVTDFVSAQANGYYQ